jgi:hypothetical protein
MVMIIVQNNVTFMQTECGASVGMMFLLLFLPIAVVVKQDYKIWKIDKKVINDPSPLTVIIEPSPSSILAVRESTVKNQASYWKTIFQSPNIGEDYTILQALFSIDMLLLFLATVCSPYFNGSGQLWTNWNILRISTCKYKQFRVTFKHMELFGSCCLSK